MIKPHTAFSGRDNSPRKVVPRWIFPKAQYFPAVFLLLIIGCNQNKSIEVSSIDHKDKPGTYRESVQIDVLGKFGGKGDIITDRSKLIGTWRWSPKFARSDVELPEFTYEMFANGKCRITGGGQDSDKNKWNLHNDGTITILHWFNPIPDIYPEGGYEEVRSFIRALTNGNCVLWNGDGSLVQVLERMK